MKIIDAKFIILFAVIGYLALFFYLSQHSLPNNNYDVNYGFPIDNGGDSATYIKLAENIINNASPTPHQKFPPGYPLFLAIILSIFKSYKAISIIQIILTALTLLFVYKISLQIIPQRYASLPLIIMIINPATAFYTLTVLSENLFVFLITAAFFLLIASQQKNKISIIILAGFIFGCATITRPVGLLLPLFSIPLIFLNHQKATPFKIIIYKIIILIVAYTATLSPWIIHDYFTYQSSQLPTPASRVNDYIKIIKDKSQHKEELYYIPYFIKTTALFYFPKFKSQSNYLFPKYRYALWYLISLLALDTIFNAFQYRQKKLLFVLFSITLYLAIISSFFLNPRYRLPAEPFLAILASLSITHLIFKIKNYG